MKRIRIVLLGLSILLLGIPIKAQIGSSGSLYIKAGGSITVFGKHNFLKGSGLIKAGMIKTDRQGEKGYLNFAKGSSWTGADKNNYINGYAKVFHDEPFVLPIGQDGIYRPIFISGGAYTSAAYYAKSPLSTEVNSILDKGITSINQEEYWDIQGDHPISITLYWGEESNLSALVDNNLASLTIVGYKDGLWKSIGSSIETGSQSLVEGLKTTIKQGIISTEESITPNDYDYFTLGVIASNSEVRADVQKIGFTIYPNPVQSELFINLEKMKGEKGTLKIYNLYGQLMEEQVYDPSTNTARFNTGDYVNGLYELKIKIDHKQSSRKFTVKRLY